MAKNMATAKGYDIVDALQNGGHAFATRLS